MSDLAAQRLKETPMVELSYDILEKKGEPILYKDIMDQIAQLKGFSEDDVKQYIAQLYTQVNIDGRFICVGRSLWGLRKWYPAEQATDSAVAANVKDDYLDEELEDTLDNEDTYESHTDEDTIDPYVSGDDHPFVDDEDVENLDDDDHADEDDEDEYNEPDDNKA